MTAARGRVPTGARLGGGAAALRKPAPTLLQAGDQLWSESVRRGLMRNRLRTFEGRLRNR